MSESKRGRSYSTEFPIGRRTCANGELLAPKSLRKQGKRLVAQCTDEELSKALNSDLSVMSPEDHGKTRT